MGRLSRGLAHETKNSLNVMALRVQLLSDGARAGRAAEGEELDRALKSFRDQIAHVDELVTRFSRFAAAELRSEPPPDLGKALGAVAGLFESEARRARLNIELDLQPGVRAGPVATALEDLLGDLLLRFCELSGYAGASLRVSLGLRAGRGRLEIAAPGAFPIAVAEAAAELARRAGVDLHSKPGAGRLAFEFEASGGPG